MHDFIMIVPWAFSAKPKHSRGIQINDTIIVGTAIIISYYGIENKI